MSAVDCGPCRMTYHYRVRSRDANGALAVSEDATFATAEE